MQSIFDGVRFRQSIWLKMDRINYNRAIENSSFEAYSSAYCLQHLPRGKDFVDDS